VADAAGGEEGGEFKEAVNVGAEGHKRQLAFFRIFSFWFLIARFFSAFSPRLFAFVRSTVAGLALRCRQ
jgi:hypothetical protein